MIAIGCDHGGFELKQEIMKHLDERNIAYKDFGTYNTDSTDYPIYAKKVAKAVAEGECESGILVCGTGIGISIAANKVKGIRCALCTDCFMAEATRQHNNANILALGGRVVGPGLALKIVDTFLDTPFSNDERHIRRINAMNEEIKALSSENDKLKAQIANNALGDVSNDVKEVKGVKYIAAKVDNVDMNELRNLGDKLKGEIGSGVVLIVSAQSDKVNMIAMATDDVIAKGAHAGNLIKAVASIVGGGGGGRPNMAQAGGKNPAGIDELLAKVPEVLEGQIK